MTMPINTQPETTPARANASLGDLLAVLGWLALAVIGVVVIGGTVLLVGLAVVKWAWVTLTH